MGSATVTIKEAFAGAFTAEADILLTLVGVPDKASLTVMHVQPADCPTPNPMMLMLRET